jgi:hypothetical protein
VILLANLTTNVAANLVSPSYDFSQLAPSKVSFRTGGLIAAVIGLLFMPWKLLATSGGYLFTWLGGYGTLLGAIAGILLVDYYLVRKGNLKVADLYRRGGDYEYSGGWNPHALIAFALGVLPCLPGYLVVSGLLAKESVAPDARQPVRLRLVFQPVRGRGLLLPDGQEALRWNGPRPTIHWSDKMSQFTLIRGGTVVNADPNSAPTCW